MRAGDGRCSSTKASPDHSLYDILGVTPSASMADIKKAYRYRAMRCHPDTDVHGKKGSEAEFIAVSSAYEVLSDSSKRRQYDEALRREPTVSGQQDRPAQQPAAGSREASDHDNSRYTSDWASSSWRRRGQKIRAPSEPPASGNIPTQVLDPQEVAKWRYSTGSWMMKVPQPDTTPSNSPLGRYLDRYQREFEGDLRSALRLAYLGPSLHHLAPSQLPKHFEAEERTDPLSNNILNLVSGRTLLGSISLSPEAESDAILPDLPSSSTKSQDLSEYEPSTSYSHPRTLFGPAIESAFDPLRFFDPPDRREAEIALGNIVVKLLEEHRGGSVDPSKFVLGGLRLRRQRFPETIEGEMPQLHPGKRYEAAANEESVLKEELEEEMQEVFHPSKPWMKAPASSLMI
jgi:curved DNA-binding protein CbpA